MRLFDQIGDTLKMLKVYLLGRGFLSLAVIGAAGVASAFGLGVAVPAAVVAFGGVALKAVTRWQKQSLYEQNMVDLYREDIAQSLGLNPGDVTRGHLKEAAKSNDVIDQALKRQRNISMVHFATSALAGVATFGLINFGILEVGREFFSGFGETAGNLTRYFTMGTVAGVSSLMLHDGLDSAIGYQTGLNKAAAHDRILELDYDVRRGRGVSKEQVYGVLVAGNPELQQAIRKEFGRNYTSMKPMEQSEVMERIGVAQEMQVVAMDINARRVAPSHLAYMMNDAVACRHTDHVQMTHLPTPARAHAPTRTQAPLRSHVESVGGKPRFTHDSFTARVNAERAAALAEQQR